MMRGIDKNMHVAIHQMTRDPVNGVTKWMGGSGRSWAVWIPGPTYPGYPDNGFLCYCPPETVVPLDLPEHVWDDGPCSHCP